MRCQRRRCGSDLARCIDFSRGFLCWKRRFRECDVWRSDGRRHVRINVNIRLIASRSAQEDTKSRRRPKPAQRVSWKHSYSNKGRSPLLHLFYSHRSPSQTFRLHPHTLSKSILFGICLHFVLLLINERWFCLVNNTPERILMRNQWTEGAFQL